MKKLTKEQILALHRELIKAHGGSGGIRDEGLLDSAFAAPFQTLTANPCCRRSSKRLSAWDSA